MSIRRTSIKHWPLAERPREKLLARGAGALSEAELLALVLQCGPGGRNAVELARHLLAAYGGLRRLLHAEPSRLSVEPGLGPARVTALKALPELAQRYFGEKLLAGRRLRNPGDTREFLIAKLRDLPHEVFACVYLDNRHRVIRYEELFRGTIDGTSVYPREVVKRALALNAGALILAHNHPSGVAEPSAADENLTRRLKAALALVDIRLLDHLIIGDGVSTSLASRGLV